jgi:ElaB/YqjD/DUF883 family membrane-anchored ribosome-binding protein
MTESKREATSTPLVKSLVALVEKLETLKSWMSEYDIEGDELEANAGEALERARAALRMARGEE